MHLWDKGGATSEAVIGFTCGRDRVLDSRLAVFDVIGSMAHAVMLGRCGIISSADTAALLDGLATLYHEAASGRLIVDETYEDIHSLVENRLYKLSGEAAGKLHTGRSRNDQVLTDIHLWVRNESSILASEMNDLINRFLDLSHVHKDVIMPGMTHMQAAMASSFGLWFGAYAESLCDDIQYLLFAQSLVNASPLGTAAGYGTSLPIDRAMTAGLLHFDRLIITSPYAQMSRGRSERVMTQAIASAADTLGRFASDVVTFMSPGFGFVTLSDDLTTGSSIMPQKKNPDLFEIIRARCNRLQSLPGEITIMTRGLPPGYNRDFQELKEILFGAFDEIRELIQAFHLALQGLVVNRDIMQDGKHNIIFAAEQANRLALTGIPFREAYRAVAEKVGSGLFDVPVFADYTHIGSIGSNGSEMVRERARTIMEQFRVPDAETIFQLIINH